uniref:Potassium channel domain-containing protein n=1 Tax=Magallana gigas TaxID=29159 RepID=A0A8W8I6X6_MAGGI|nr:potassium channel subfamily K member 2 isoform X2 [Crassostrea gigas]XP_034325661.1 potassium channel subfamily K member 2 isoform X2 [Crassostrea gigas]|eukprot:XP_011453129.1 PREDICTED: potassium channel subfamily K member 2 isoform X2 [Crassostrea gigas]
METKTLLILITVVVVYVLIGGAVLYGIEHTNELQTQTTASATYFNFTGAVSSCVTTDQVRQFVTAIIQAYDDGVLVTDSQTSASQWDYASSTFFAMTAVTTIGYGNQAPATSGGKAFIVIYALLGIPIMGLVLAGLGEKLDGLLKPLKDKVFIKKNEKIDQLVKTLILVALILLVMSLIPAGIFAAIEGWSYGDAVYYTIITMTTIGFGDFVIGTSDNDYRALYKLLSSVWILLGLASVAMLLSNITDLYKRIAPESKTDDEEKDEKEKNENKESSEKEKPAETKDPIKA